MFSRPLAAVVSAGCLVVGALAVRKGYDFVVRKWEQWESEEEIREEEERRSERERNRRQEESQTEFPFSLPYLRSGDPFRIERRAFAEDQVAIGQALRRQHAPPSVGRRRIHHPCRNKGTQVWEHEILLPQSNQLLPTPNLASPLVWLPVRLPSGRQVSWYPRSYSLSPPQSDEEWD